MILNNQGIYDTLNTVFSPPFLFDGISSASTDVPDNIADVTKVPKWIFIARQPNRSFTQEFPQIPQTSVETPLIEATLASPYLFRARQPKRFTDVFVNNLDLPPEIVTPPIEATLYPSWLQYRAQYQKRYVDVQQSPGQAPPSTDTPLIESTLVPGWKFIPRQPRRAVEGFNPFLPPLLRTCEITTLFTTNYRRANPNPMMPVAKITRIYKIKGLVEC